ncbi:MAG TPA: HEAT repeat domain-containing protein [Ktedonobacterales bacterium]|nr:HEAT repeat domain-containing protein [Ktedonobacterales bacterium]
MASTGGDDNPGDSQTSDELGSADPQALDQLLVLLSDPEWLVVKAALQSLRRYRDPRIVPAVQAVVECKDSFTTFTRGWAISHAATRALRSQGEAGFQALLTMLREFHDDGIWGRAVVRQLAVLRDPRAIGPLVECFGSPEFEVAYCAAKMMRHFGADAIPPLIVAMGTTNRGLSVWALRSMGVPAVPALLDALRHAADENIRAGAADVLDSADSEDVREALRAALEDPAADVRREAMWSLGHLGDLRVLDLLLAEQSNPSERSPRPAMTLTLMGGMAVPSLIAALEDRERPAYQRVNAAQALGFIAYQRVNAAQAHGVIAAERAVEPLIAALRDDNEDVRVAATVALGGLKDARAVEPLLTAWHASSSEVRSRTAYVLASVDDDRAFDAVARFVRESGEGDQSASGILMTLALHHGERALPLLREMALDSDFRRWSGTLPALGQLGAAAVPTLLELARDPLPERRHGAINWLKAAYHRSHDPRIVEFLVEVIQEYPTSSKFDIEMRYHAALALGECGDPRAVEPLLEILQNAPTSMGYPVVQPLGELGDERVLEALTAIYEESRAGKDRLELDERPEQRYAFQNFQDALLRAMAKIRSRLGTTRSDQDASGEPEAM